MDEITKELPFQYATMLNNLMTLESDKIGALAKLFFFNKLRTILTINISLKTYISLYISRYLCQQLS